MKNRQDMAAFSLELREALGGMDWHTEWNELVITSWYRGTLGYRKTWKEIWAGNLTPGLLAEKFKKLASMTEEKEPSATILGCDGKILYMGNSDAGQKLTVGDEHMFQDWEFNGQEWVRIGEPRLRKAL